MVRQASGLLRPLRPLVHQLLGQELLSLEARHRTWRGGLWTQQSGLCKDGLVVVLFQLWTHVACHVPRRRGLNGQAVQSRHLVGHPLWCSILLQSTCDVPPAGFVVSQPRQTSVPWTEDVKSGLAWLNREVADRTGLLEIARHFRNEQIIWYWSGEAEVAYFDLAIGLN